MDLEQMEKINWLNRAFHIKHAVEALELVREEKENIYDNSGKMNLNEADKKINHAKQNLVKVYLEIEQKINGIEDIELRTILTMRYLAFKHMREIADSMNYDVRTIQRKHKRALDFIEI